MRILITGSNGYIGKSLYNTLKDKYDITIINRNICDLTNSSSVNSYFSNTWFDTIIHCAISGGHRNKTDGIDVIDNNLRMYYNLIQNKSSYSKFINIASGAEIISPESPYGLSKRIISKSILDKDDFFNLKIFAVFDENELETRFIKANIKRYINNQPMQIHFDKYMDFIYMPDLIKIVEYYLENINLPKQTDCTYNTVYKLTEIADIINELGDYRVEIKVDGIDESYTGRGNSLPINYIGLKQGIKEVYNKLK